jgi:uncharacterized protein
MQDEGGLQPIASARHTRRLVAILLLIAAAGFIASRESAAGPVAPAGGTGGLYVGLLAAEWGLFAFVRVGLKKHGTALCPLVSARRLTSRTLAFDMMFGFLLFAALLGIEAEWSSIVGSGRPPLVEALLARRLALIPLWLLLAASAGFIEEIVFRGYLQRQFGAWLGHAWLGVVAQAVLFGVTHGYQGLSSVIGITLYGLLLGAAALLRRSLVPGIFAHALTDTWGGLAAFR